MILCRPYLLVLVAIDGIFGSGLTRPVTGFPARVIDHINQSGSEIVAIDIPSGLSGEDNRDNTKGAVVEAGHTLTFQFPFLSFFFAENERYTGRWTVVDIGLNKEMIEKLETDYYFLTREMIREKIKIPFEIQS